MLVDSKFYSVTSIDKIAAENAGKKLSAVLEINPLHEIFKGHFPAVPVVPGVCMMQIVKEILESDLGRQTRLAKASNMKFLTVINPLVNPSVRLELTYTDDLQVTAALLNEGVTYFKFRGIFV